jgi:hypothetical protein
MHRDLPEEVAEAVRIWRGTETFCEAPSSLATTAAMAACERLADKPQAHELAVFSLLDDDCGLVVAYALHTLRLMRSAHLASLPATLLERHDRIKERIGSFRFCLCAWRYARQLRTLALHDEF